MTTPVLHRAARRAEPARGASIILAAACCLLSGCSNWAYDRFQIGQEWKTVERVLPADATRRTAPGVCCLVSDITGRTDAIVVLLTRDQRIAAKLQTTRFERHYGFKVETGVRFRAEIDPHLARLEGSGPIDTLRAVADELTAVEGEKLIRDAHGWIGASIIRILQRWPHAGDEGPTISRVSEALERVPGGGTARIGIDQRGVYMIEYAHGIGR
ncbi:hypothetical protein RAS1_00190 [Phycisphaerae bacterium RAS1]|nr:hypothetical protein RAS1_00190 [Phycisphaerae bacterium RAS1]